MSGLACIVGTWPQAVGVVLFSALAGFIIKVKTDHPL